MFQLETYTVRFKNYLGLTETTTLQALNDSDLVERFEDAYPDCELVRFTTQKVILH
jgi:hypothetical protein